MSKRLIMATIRDQIAGQQVEVRVEYPWIQIRFLETGTSRMGRIYKFHKGNLSILWSRDQFTGEEEKLEHDVLRICREAQLVWAREPQIIEEENAAP